MTRGWESGMSESQKRGDSKRLHTTTRYIQHMNFTSVANTVQRPMHDNEC